MEHSVNFLNIKNPNVSLPSLQFNYWKLRNLDVSMQLERLLFVRFDNFQVDDCIN